MNLLSLLQVARGVAPADLVLANARIANVFNGEIETGNVAILGEVIAGVGDYTQAREVLDIQGQYLAPGFIDGHTHLESSLLHIAQYARAVVPRGTTGIVTDLHEIANVAGLEGINYVRRWARRLPLEFYLMVPSSVPTTSLETSGAHIGPREVKALLRGRDVLGLGEVMNFPGVIYGEAEVLEKVEAAQGWVRDGHAPGLSDRDLNAYLATEISSDHECTSLREAEEKLRRGMYIMIREGSSEKNLEALLPLVTDKTYTRCLFVVDDRTCLDMLRDGDMEAVVRKAISLGLDPVRAIRLATLNPAQYFGMGRVGAVAPGYRANLITFNNLNSLKVNLVFHRGHLVAREGEPLFPDLRPRGGKLSRTMRVKPFSIEALRLPASRRGQPVIQIVPGQIVTRKLVVEARVKGDEVVADLARDMLKLVVVERHRGTGNIGLGLVQGFGLRSGALASSVAHDSHNIIAVGVQDRDIYLAIQEVIRLGGGLVVASGGEVLGSLPLPIAGLLSLQPLGVVARSLEALESLASQLGCRLPSPFATLSFLALPVVPQLRLTDQGLVEREPRTPFD